MLSTWMAEVGGALGVQTQPGYIVSSRTASEETWELGGLLQPFVGRGLCGAQWLRRPWTLPVNRQLCPGSFSYNGICSMGFGLEHQIKSTSGVGVNGGSESLEACGSNGFHFIRLRAPFQQKDRVKPKRTGQPG